MPDRLTPGGDPPPGTFKEPLPLEDGPRKEIVRRIAEKGPITFAEFMDVALYWPDGGYYTSPDSRWGGGGDYITSLDVSPVFAKVLAKQINEMWEVMGKPDDFALIEAGAGRGWLSKGIIDSLKDLFSALGNIIKAHLIEKNPNLREAPFGRISWHEDLKKVPGPVTGCILSNELIDSFPVHRFEFRGGKLLEVYTGFDGETFIDVYGPPSTTELEVYFRELGIELAEGQKGEVNISAIKWIKEAASLLSKGFIITIDYGLPAKELYFPERKGTLLCHYRHTLNDNPYLNIGSQDITAHADFTMLAKAGAEAGLSTAGFTTQKNFLLGLGILEELKEATDLDLENQEKISFNRALSRLIMPGGMGDTFKVLIQHKGVEGTPVLSGFSFKNMLNYLFR